MSNQNSMRRNVRTVLIIWGITLALTSATFTYINLCIAEDIAEAKQSQQAQVNYEPIRLDGTLPLQRTATVEELNRAKEVL